MNPIRRRRIGGFQYPNIAAHFTAASSQSASIADNAALSLGSTQNFTVAGWHWLDDKTAHRAFFGKATNFTGAATCEYGCWYRSDSDRYEVRTSTGATLNTILANNFGSPVAGVWNFVACRYNGANLTISVNAGTANTAVVASIQDSTGAFSIGNFPGLVTVHNGAVDATGFWRRSLSDAELATLYNGGVGMALRDLPGALSPNLTAWWDFDGNWNDGVSTNNLTPNNGPTFIAGKR